VGTERTVGGFESLERRRQRGASRFHGRQHYCCNKNIAWREFCRYLEAWRLSSIRKRAQGAPESAACRSNWRLKSIGARLTRLRIAGRTMARRGLSPSRPLNGRLHVVCYCLRAEARRIISFREANEREERFYVEAKAAYR
jgi:hypothetical protein